MYYCKKRMKLTALFLFLLFLLEKAHSLSWAMSGGGWRAAMASFGYGTLFANMGLFQDEASLFSTIASNSGASWYVKQKREDG
jgi:hypothetical protein